MLIALEYDSENHLTRIVRGVPADGILELLGRGQYLTESDVEWCRRDECYYANNVGSWTGRIYLGHLVGGARHRLVARNDATFSTARDDRMISVDEITELGYDLEQFEKCPNLKGIVINHAKCYYCDRCDDWIPERDPCECVYWCEECGDFFSKRHDQCEHYCGECEAERRDHYCDKHYANTSDGPR